ncbi:MAG: diguanylate cyclase [Desulfobacterales bacterium]|nr:diguanylate cyclase [Desulfobacterales bacterium]
MNKRFLQTSLRAGHLIFLTGIIWIVVIAASFVWNWHQVGDSMMVLVENAAQFSFEKDVVYRRWGAMHGGVYVPVTKATPPNPYLSHLPDRDVVTTSGKQLTLINPAYMTRQVHELGRQQYGMRGHITSLDPLRPENAADAWETEALLSFQKGAEQATSVETIAGQPYFRLMRPMVTEEKCLKCHAHQGYAIGDIRGGVSVSVPLATYLSQARTQRTGLAIVHVLVGFFGLVGLEFGRRLHGSSERKLGENESLVRAINESAQDAIVVMDAEGRISYWNPAAEHIFGYTSDEAIGQDLIPMLVPSRYKEIHGAVFPEFQRSGRSDAVGKTLELKALRKSGEEFSVELSLSSVRLKGRWHAVGIIRDISERKQAEETIRQMAYHDSLTGLPNRKLFSDRLGIAFAQAGRNQNNVAVIMLDLDNFKDVNDTLGHDTGDLLLKAITERLSNALRKSDTIARFGGDEFVLILPDLKGEDHAGRPAQKIVESFRKPFLINAHQLIVTTSIGIAVYPRDGTDEAVLLKNADIAMYQAKQAGRDRYQVFKA